MLLAQRFKKSFFYDSDEDAVKDVNEVAVDDEMDYEDKDGDEVEDEDINHPNLFFFSILDSVEGDYGRVCQSQRC